MVLLIFLCLHLTPSTKDASLNLLIYYISSSKNRSIMSSYVVGVLLLDERLLSDVDSGRHKPICA